MYGYGRVLQSDLTQIVKNPPVMQEAQVQPLGWEDPLEKEMIIHSSILSSEIPQTEEGGQAPWGCKSWAQLSD